MQYPAGCRDGDDENFGDDNDKNKEYKFNLAEVKWRRNLSQLLYMRLEKNSPIMSHGAKHEDQGADLRDLQ